MLGLHKGPVFLEMLLGNAQKLCEIMLSHLVRKTFLFLFFNLPISQGANLRWTLQPLQHSSLVAIAASQTKAGLGLGTYRSNSIWLEVKYLFISLPSISGKRF